jgi:hypothetical protein
MGLPASVTLKVSATLDAAAVGVPVMAPLEASDNPLGSVPLVSVQA